MSDWRGGDDKNDKGRKDNKAKPKALPVIVPKYPSPSNETTSGTSDWRGKRRGKDSVRTESERTWTGVGKQAASSTSGLKKAVVVGTLGATIISLFALYVVYIFWRYPALPIVISISDSYSSNDLGENPFGTQTINSLKEPPKHLDLKRASDKVNAQKLYSNPEKIPSGGPDRNVTTHFVSCLIARAGKSTNSQPGEWVLLLKDDDPFSNEPDNQGLPIKEFLQRVASQTAPNCYSWIVFDVKPLTVVTNLGDLEFPYEAFKIAFHSGLEKDLQDRLIISLPCEQNQESWMAPEFSSSVFAHFFWEGVVSGFDSKKGVLTLEQFEVNLRKKVQDCVRLKRVAHQTPPEFLMTEKTKSKKQGIRLFDISTGSSKMQFSPAIKKDINDKFHTLDELWERYGKLKPCVHWEPLRFAKIESQLIQMEGLAEDNSGKTWSDFVASVSSDIVNMELSSAFTRRVSLIESKLHSQVRVSSKIFSKEILADSLSLLAPWIERPPFWVTDANSKQKELESENPNLHRDSKCLQVWTVLELVANKDDVELWTNSFNSNGLNSCLKYCDELLGQNQNEWLEMQVLHILWDAVKSEPNSPTISKAIARAIRTFSDLNAMAFDSNRELTRWTESQLLQLDEQFLRAFDLLVANSFDKCISEFDKMQSGVDKLKTEFSVMKNAMAVRDDVLWQTPHILAALMRDFRYSTTEASKLEILEKSRQLRKTLNEALVLRDFFAGDPKTKKLQLNSDATKKGLDELVEYMNKKYSSVSMKALSDSGTIPKTRIALRWPTLKLNLRKEFHTALAESYSKNGDSKEELTDASKITDSSSNEVAKEFCTDLDEFGKALYQNIALDDPRYLGMATISRDAPRAQVDDSNKIATFVYNTSYKTRIIANSFGQRATASRAREDEWPWDAPTQFDKINSAYYNLFQAERLCLARWGDGNLNAPKNGKFYYQRLENEFDSADSLLKNLAQSNSLAEELDKRRAEFSTIAAQELKQVDVKVSPVVAEGDAFVPLSLEANKWKAMATLFVQSRESGGRKKVLASKINRSMPISFDEKGTRSEMKMDKSDIGEPLRISVRGHFRDQLIRPADTRSTEVVEFKRPPLNPPTVRVTALDSDPITLWVLLDCSMSMDVNGGGIFKNAQQTAKNLIDKVRDYEESPIQVGFIAFGRLVKPGDTSLELTQCPIGNQIFKSKVKSRSQIDDLIPVIDSLRPSGCTPLYDAIYTACEESKRDDRNWIVVISDGSNQLDLLRAGQKDDGGFYIHRNGDKTVRQLKDKIVDSKSSLFVFQYNNHAYIDKNKKEYGSDWVADIEKANGELQTLLNDVSPKRGSKGTKLFYDDFKKLNEDLVALLPSTNITVMANGIQIGTGRLNQEIPLNLELTAPTKATVSVKSNGPAFDADIWLSGNEQLEMVYSSTLGLSSVSFNENRIKKGISEFLTQMQDMRGGKEQFFANPIPDSQYRLKLQLAMQGTGSKDDKQKNFTRRPKFVVAAMTPSNGGLESASRLISDSFFVPGTHYPILEFPSVPWKGIDDWLSELVDFDVWIANDLPGKALKVPMNNPEQKELFGSQITCSRNGSRLTVLINPNKGERFFVICQSAQKSIRKYEEGQEKEAVFEFAESGDNPVELIVLEESELKADRIVTHYFSKEIRIIKK